MASLSKEAVASSLTQDQGAFMLLVTVLCPGDAALRVPHEDVEGFTVAMNRLLTDNDLRADMIAKGQKRVQCFSWERAARETLDVYKKVADGRSNG